MLRDVGMGIEEDMLWADGRVEERKVGKIRSGVRRGTIGTGMRANLETVAVWKSSCGGEDRDRERETALQ